MAIPADEYDAFKKRLPSVYPELEVDSFEGVMQVDRQRRLEGRPVSSIGQALEDTFARVRPSWSDPAEADSASRGPSLTDSAPRDDRGPLRRGASLLGSSIGDALHTMSSAGNFYEGLTTIGRTAEGERVRLPGSEALGTFVGEHLPAQGFLNQALAPTLVVSGLKAGTALLGAAGADQGGTRLRDAAKSAGYGETGQTVAEVAGALGGGLLGGSIGSGAQTAAGETWRASRAAGSSLAGSGGAVARELVNGARNILTSLDLSALRQGAMLGPGHPIATARAFVDMLKGAWSEESAVAINADIRQRPIVQMLTTRAKPLFLSSLDDVAQREETQLASWPERLPGIGRGIRASNRAYTTFLNSQRAGVAEALVGDVTEVYPGLPAAMGANIPQGWRAANRSAKQIDLAVDFINRASGRGDLPAFLSAHRATVNAAAFAPSFALSRFQTPITVARAVATGTWDAVAHGEANAVAGMIVKDAAAFLTAGAAINRAIGWQFPNGVETDPNSADWGKAVVGTVRYDVWGGGQQAARYAWRMLNAAREGDTEAAKDLTERFVRTKLGPLPSAAVNLWTGRNAVGAKTSLEDEVVRSLTPMIVQSFVEVFGNEGLAHGAVGTIASGLGAGVQSYGALDRDLNKAAPGGDFKALDATAQQQVYDANPALAQRKADDRLEASGATGEAEAVRRRYADQITALDQELASNKLAPDAHFTAVEKRMHDRTLVLKGVYEGEAKRASKDAIMDGFYKAITDATGATGETDWDAVDSYRASLDETTNAHIDRSTGVSKGVAGERAVLDLKRELRDAKFYETGDDAWSVAQQAAPSAAEYKSARAYEAAMRAELSAFVKEQLGDTLVAQDTVEKMLAKLPALAAYNKLLPAVRQLWVTKNPDIAIEAVQVGKVSAGRTTDAGRALRALELAR